MSRLSSFKEGAIRQHGRWGRGVVTPITDEDEIWLITPHVCSKQVESLNGLYNKSQGKPPWEQEEVREK